MAEQRTGNEVVDGAFKSGEMEVVDFQKVVPAFTRDVNLEEVEGVDELEDINITEIAADVEGGSIDQGLESIQDEVEDFLEEAERAGKSNPVLYVPDQHYDNLPEDSGSRVDVGAVEGAIPVRILPMQRDLMHMLSRFSFGPGMKQLLEDEDEAGILVNPTGMETYTGRAEVEVGEDVAEEAYDSVMNAVVGDLEYLEGQRGVGVMETEDTVEIQVDERAIGRGFDYRVEEDVLVMEFGDETVELEYSGDVYHGTVDREEGEVFDPRARDAEIYKFVVED